MKRHKQYYMVMGLFKDWDVDVSGVMTTKIDLSFADGMTGVIPIFTNKRKAKKFAGKKYTVIPCEIDTNNAM